MEEEQQQIVQQASPREYFTMLPNLVDDSGLNVHEFRLLAHYYRVGVCWESLTTTAEHCQMSRPTVVKTRRSLAEKGWIILEVQPHRGAIIEVVDRWVENSEHFMSGKKETPQLVKSRHTKNIPLRRKRETQLKLIGDEEGSLPAVPQVDDLAREIGELCGVASDRAAVLYPAAYKLVKLVGSVEEARRAVVEWGKDPRNLGFATKVGPFAVLNQIAVKGAQLQSDEDHVIRSVGG